MNCLLFLLAPLALWWLSLVFSFRPSRNAYVTTAWAGVALACCFAPGTNPDIGAEQMRPEDVPVSPHRFDAIGIARLAGFIAFFAFAPIFYAWTFEWADREEDI
jgi:hypothetical protein